MSSSQAVGNTKATIFSNVSKRVSPEPTSHPISPASLRNVVTGRFQNAAFAAVSSKFAGRSVQTHPTVFIEGMLADALYCST